ncbi:putative flagellar-associated protein 172 [Blattamonas nauphoetae]|uniref:Flagellar-associated protein 172 n=1 Tax=Blattamonas nauphoetae TaxID=2049346 RepID=A0ABQ9YI60_9EUKA|nr:putative flagellar-associated protein 172 [Blattamonas nauphoetae]
MADYNNDGDDYEEEVEPIDPNNPVIARVQAQIKEELQKEIEELKLQKYEKSAEVKRITEEREQVGVELYNLQQELANRYTELEQLKDNYNLEKEKRDKSDEDLITAQDEVNNKKGTLSGLQLKVANTQRELDKANEKLMDLKQYNEQILSEIAVARRDTYHTDDTLAQQEQQKQEQDYMIARLELDLQSLQEQYSLVEAQLIAQQKETELAKETIHAANQEKETALLEQRQLLMEFNTASIGIQRRDEALQQTEEGLREQRENILTLNSEIIGYKSLIRTEEEKCEKQTLILTNTRSDEGRLQKRIEESKATHEKALQDLGLLKKSADSVERDVENVRGQVAKLKGEVQSLQSILQKLTTEQIQVEDKISAFLNEQMSFDQFTKSTANKREKVLDSVREKDMEAAGVQNELERLKLDIINTQAHSASLKKALDELVRQLKEKDAIIEKFEVEIRRKNDEISKKQSEVDKLNRKYDSIVQNKTEEDKGPLEATIHNLNKEIAAKKEECSELERNWMRLQMSLLSLVKQNDTITTEVRQLETQLTLQSQRQLRLETQLKQETREVHQLEEAIKNLHTKMQLMNQEISKRNKLHDNLATTTVDIEARFVDLLKTLEEEAVRLEQELDEQKRMHEQMNEDIVECERQMLLWQRKIELEKETQSTLDVSGAESEIRGMEEEIRRMELRLQQIKKAEDEIEKKMEQKIMARISLAQSGAAKGRLGMGGATTRGAGMTKTRTMAGTGGLGATRNGVKTEVHDLQRKIRAIEAEVTRTDEEMRGVSETQTELQKRVNELAEQNKRFREETEQEQVKTTNLLMEKQKNLDKLTRCQRFIKRYENELKGTWNSGVKTPEELESKMQKEKERKQALDTVIERLREQFPFIHSLA